MSLKCFVWVYIAASVSEWLGHNRSVGRICSVYCSGMVFEGVLVLVVIVTYCVGVSDTLNGR
jgi:hypothetical protein